MSLSPIIWKCHGSGSTLAHMILILETSNHAITFLVSTLKAFHGFSKWGEKSLPFREVLPSRKQPWETCVFFGVKSNQQSVIDVIVYHIYIYTYTHYFLILQQGYPHGNIC